MVAQRSLPSFFVTLSAYDCWRQTQATFARGWGSKATEETYNDLARKLVLGGISVFAGIGGI